MKNNNDQKRITVNVDAEIYAQLERVAKESGIQIITAVVRQAIVFYLSQKNKKGGRAMNFYCESEIRELNSDIVPSERPMMPCPYETDAEVGK